MRLLGFLLLSMAVLTPSLAMAAPDISVAFTRATGVGPFDANDAPGNDSSATNAIIRTNDTTSYRFEVVVLDDDATNVVLRLQVGSGLDLGLPAFCRDSGVSPLSSISGDAASGYTLVCNVGNINEGSQVLYALPATVVPERANGSIVSLITASVESDQTAAEVFPGADDTVSAAPKLDLIKDDQSRLLGRREGPSGEDGVVYAFSLQVASGNNGKGNELVTGPISFTDDLSGVSPNALLYQGWTGSYADACVPNETSGYQRLWTNPRGNTRTNDGGPGGDGAGPAERSVWNSGTIDCTSPAPGGVSTITITGADLSGRHYPTLNSNGGSLPANLRYLVSGVLYIWIPISDIQDAGGQLQINNVYSALTAQSISNQSNTEPSSTNNRRSFIAQNGGNGRSFYNHQDHNTYNIVPSQTARRSGDGYVLPDQIFATRHYQNNGAWLTKDTLDNIVFCTSFDNATQRITEITPGQGAKVTTDGTPEGAQPAFTIEYGTGGFGGSETCDDADSPAGWHGSMDSVPGGSAAITKVRASAAYLAAPGGNSTNFRGNLIVRYTALDNPAGTIVAEWGTYKIDQQNGGNWILSTYDANTGLGNYGDRLFLTKVAVRLNKDTVPSGETDALARVDEPPLTFRIQPSATTPGDPPELTTDVIVTDTLPPWYEYVFGSATPPPSSFTGNPDGTTSLVWEFPDTTINAPMSAIEYEVQVKPTTPDQTTAINTAVISSPNDGSPESQRTDTYSILILNPSGFSISKSALPVLVAPNGNFSYRLTYANTGTSDFAGVTFIDVLPSEQVTQSPATNFDGTTAFVSASGTNGETFEYTKANPTTIDPEPTAASNQPGGATVWCSSFSGGACPASAAQVTGVRGTSASFLQGQPPRDVTITMSGNANDSFDAYSNRFTARADGLAFSVTSQTATVYVRTADVSLDKTATGPDPLYPNLVTFTLTASNAGPHAADGVKVRDVLPPGFRFVDASSNAYDPGTGIWSPGPIPVGGSRKVALRVEVIPGGGSGYTNTAEVIEQLHADPDSQPANRASAPNEDDSDTASVSRLSGVVFLDNGIAGGTAHDGIPNGGEVGGVYGRVVLRDTATGRAQTIADVAADGRWFAVLAGGLPGEFEAVFTPDPAYLLMSEGANGLPALVNSDPRDGVFRFTPSDGVEYTGLDFGLIAKPILVQDQIASISPGQVVDVPHRYLATSAGTVAFTIVDRVSVPADSFSSALFADPNCDGKPDSPLPAGFNVLAGQSACIIVRTQASGGVGSGARYTYGLNVVTAFASTPVRHNARNDDLLTVGGGDDKLALRKFVTNITAGTPEATANAGKLGDVLQYRLIIVNDGTGPARNMKVNDATPAWTSLSAAVAPNTMITPGVTCVLAQPSGTANVPGYVGPLQWTCPGAFPPGAEGSLIFRVQISP